MGAPKATEHQSTQPSGAEDVETDPALDDGNQSDWTSEGGAMPSGPATGSNAARPATGDASSD